MKILFFVSLTTAILSGVWAWIANTLGLIGWAGFLGCTAYFAYPKDGIKGLVITMLTIISGIIWGLLIIHGSLFFKDSPDFIGYFITTIIAFIMCIQAHKIWFSYIPGTFIGACAVFAAQGEWAITLQSLLIGALFGYTMKKSGLWLASKWA